MSSNVRLCPCYDVDVRIGQQGAQFHKIHLISHEAPPFELKDVLGETENLPPARTATV